MVEIDMIPARSLVRTEGGMFAKGLTAAVSCWSLGPSLVRTSFPSIIERRTVVSKLVAFAVMMALVLSMAGCKVLDIG
jgi:hypothetical protein